MHMLMVVKTQVVFFFFLTSCALLQNLKACIFFFLDCKYGAVSNDNIHLRIELRTEYNENPRQLMKVYAL